MPRCIAEPIRQFWAQPDAGTDASTASDGSTSVTLARVLREAHGASATDEPLQADVARRIAALDDPGGRHTAATSTTLAA